MEEIEAEGRRVQTQDLRPPSADARELLGGYVDKLALVALVLGGALRAREMAAPQAHSFYAAPRRRRTSSRPRRSRRHAALHVVRVGSRYFLIGTGGLNMLAESWSPARPKLYVKYAELTDLVAGGFDEVDLAVEAERHRVGSEFAVGIE